MSRPTKRPTSKPRAAVRPRKRVADPIVDVRPAAPAEDQVTLLGPPVQASLNWLDANACNVERWFEWQRLVWQPIYDWQATQAWRWYEVWAPSLIEPAVMRGEEQLA